MARVGMWANDCDGVDGYTFSFSLVLFISVSANQKKDIWHAIAKEVRTLGVHHRRSTHCHKRWEDIRRWSKKTAEAQLGMASQRGMGARRTMTPPYVPDPGGGVSGLGWALEGIPAAPRG
ncbi:hypothetical protein NDU88_007210 [Pleurodeles waltl]|uniref:Myb/SANT-like DNA-binding domain-containing protein n=1 Tax=Pleurodeles waltl TaxID=8319 RepID=A0AAV7SRU0_PLEWA|nr:hypothetical protein NDU88_007210 [Pleurodeles waltl]